MRTQTLAFYLDCLHFQHHIPSLPPTPKLQSLITQSLGLLLSIYALGRLLDLKSSFTIRRIKKKNQLLFTWNSNFTGRVLYFCLLNLETYTCGSSAWPSPLSLPHRGLTKSPLQRCHPSTNDAAFTPYLSKHLLSLQLPYTSSRDYI